MNVAITVQYNDIIEIEPIVYFKGKKRNFPFVLVRRAARISLRLRSPFSSILSAGRSLGLRVYSHGFELLAS